VSNLPAAARAVRRGRGVGIVFLCFFGTSWLAMGCYTLFGPGMAVVAPAVIAGGLLFCAGWRLARRESFRRQNTDAEARRSKVFRNVNIAQWGAIIALITVLNIVGHGEWILPGIMFIVGVHFFPLAVLFENKAHWVTGAALALLAAIYPLVASGGPASPLGPLGAGLILLIAACASLTEALRR
jgi:hypothetical protein